MPNDNTFSDYLDGVADARALRAIYMVINGIACIAALFLLIVGVTGLSDMFKEFGGTALPITSIILGCLVAVLSLVGIVGSIKRSQYVFGTYSGLLTLLVVLQLVALTTIWLRPHDIQEKFGDIWQQMYKNDRGSIKYIERDLKCCGFKNPKDRAVPKLCLTDERFGYQQGCIGPLETQWHHRREVALWAGFAMVAAQVVVLVIGTELARRYRRARQDYQQVPRRNEDDPLLRAT